ncbi:MAG: hypothetical protein JRD68_13655, partial [Deltaproteobacteria bacterium]|nr:hypothetical protein [Deltaproteobacteria bacterium]
MRKTLFLFISFLLLFLLSGSSGPAFSAAAESNGTHQLVFWYEGKVRKQAWMALDEMAFIPGKTGLSSAEKETLAQRIHPEARVIGESGSMVYSSMPGSVSPGQAFRRSAMSLDDEDFALTSPVFYTAESRDPAGRMILTGEIIVQFPKGYTEKKVSAVELEYGLSRVKVFSYAPNTFLYRIQGPRGSLDTANALHQSRRVNFAYPDWLRGRAIRAVPDDTLFPDQWHLENTGQGGGLAGEDVNVVGVWDTYRGSPNEVIAIVDDG